MSYTQEQFLKALFNEGEVVGFKEQAAEKPRSQLTESAEYFVVNPLKDTSSASNENVAAYRNILVEIDTMYLKRQENLIENMLKMPFTTKVFSGNRSYHYVIAFTEDIGKERYEQFTKALKIIIPRADHKCFNPARLSRLGGAIRKTVLKTKKPALQEILLVGERVQPVTFATWISRFNDLLMVAAERERLKKARLETMAKEYNGVLAPWVARMLEEGSSATLIKSRHDTLLAMSVSMRNTNVPYDEAANKLLDFASAIGKDDVDEVTRIINWAYGK